MKLVCSRCKSEELHTDAYKCPNCGYPLEAEYEGIKSFEPKLGINMWSFSDVLPFGEADPVTIGEGMTPTISAPRLSQQLGHSGIFIKNECANPTGSFKDRALSVCATVARECKKDGIVVASSGNGAASTSAYAARCGLKSVVLVPETTPDAKVTQSRMYGANVVKVEGNFTNCYNLAKKVAEKGFYNVTTTFLNPYAMEGYKTIGLEIFIQLGKVPDWIILPVGDGPILGGVYKAFSELIKAGKTDRIPHLAAVQAKNCSPITEAFLSGQQVKSWDFTKPTIASALADPLNGYEEDGDYTIDCILKSGGWALSLDEDEIFKSASLLAGLEGIYAEPGGAVSVGAVQKLIQMEKIKSSDTVVLVVTGHGLKFDYSSILDLGKEILVVNNVEGLEFL